MADIPLADVIPHWLVGAKVQPPRTSNDELVRADLSIQTGNHLISFLEAPAGYGKTTVANQIRQKWLKEENARAAWLTVTTDDTEHGFLEYAAFSLLKAGIDLPESFFTEAVEVSDVRPALNTLVNRIEHSGKNWLFIVDDLENANERVCGIIEYFFSICPNNLCFLLVGRSNPAIKLSSYKLKGQLASYSLEEFCFSCEEISNLLGSDITLEGARKIHEATLGWPMAVQLVNLDIKSGCSLLEALERLSDHSQIASLYIQEQIDTRLEPETRSMMLKASILDWLEPDAVNHILGEDSILDHINDLGEIRSLISEAEDKSNTHRIHPLLREFLQETLQKEDLDTYKRLHYSAAEWMASQNRLRLALKHASKAGADALIGKIIEGFGAVRLFIQEGVSRTFDTVKYLNDHITSGFPRVALMKCAVLTKMGHLADARALYLEIEKETSGFKRDRDGGNDEELSLEHGFCLPFLVRYGCLPEEALSSIDLYRVPKNIEDMPLVGGAYNNMLCLTYFVRGQLGEAKRCAVEAMRYFEICSSVYGQMFIDLHRGTIALYSGDKETAARYYASTQAKQKRFFKSDEGARLVYDVQFAEKQMVLGELGKLEDTLTDLAKRLAAHEAWRDIYIVATDIVANFWMLKKSPEQAIRFIEQLTGYAEQEKLVGVIPFLQRQLISLRVFSRHHEGVDELLNGDCLASEQDILKALEPDAWRAIECQTLTLFKIQYFLGQTKATAELASAVSEYFLKLGLVLPALRVLITAACAEWRIGRKTSACDLFGKGMELIVETGITWPLPLYRDTVKEMLEHLSGTMEGSQIDEWRAVVLEQSQIVTGPRFSPRELDVLEHLVLGKQDKVIARELGVTEHAVRYHLKNIYTKMQVPNRYQAIVTAQSLELFP